MKITNKMSNKKEGVLEEQVVEQNIDSKELEEKIVVVKITDPTERMAALHEIDVLSRLINTSYFMPKWDNASKRGEQPKITGSIQLNYFNGKNMSEWGTRITLLTESIS